MNASPDLRQQILATPALAPHAETRSSPIVAVIVTNAEVDHVAGLLSIRERQPFALYATPSTRSVLEVNPLFRVLDPRFVSAHVLETDRAAQICGLGVTAFLVPGKVPLYLEGQDDAPEDIVGLAVKHGERVCLIIPNCARITDEMLQLVEGVDLLLFDGTAFTDDEMLRQGLSEKTAARMGHVAMDGPAGSLERFAGAAIGRRVYVHINNSNPVLIEGSPERNRVQSAGWEIAEDGMEFVL